ncbi:GDSL-like Lipase/Acylhydrolase [Diaporthe helianthi]|uniref:GDSL-like Lipase/Acylhydrolase n=1 Tax=Diaporthe helianthi TaxID=158607 RepID=A0A2P5HI66_DIAHE|nr:GDSL-like Lipase/Acylhydrolase [Diaporthe helianthi]
MFRTTILSLLCLLTVVSGSPTPSVSQPENAISERAACSTRPASFVLAGDSTTAVNGGWGTGFISFLKSPAKGTNIAKSGATTVSFVEGGYWKKVMDQVKADAATHDVIVTLQFGHNDQKEDKNISLDQFQTNLENFAKEVKAAGGTPNNVTDNLHNERLRAIAAAEATSSPYIDLNKASIAFVNAIGKDAAQAYNRDPDDRTHLNEHGSVVFGRMVADLILGHPPTVSANDKWTPAADNCFVGAFKSNKTLTHAIWSGLPA